MLTVCVLMLNVPRLMLTLLADVDSSFVNADYICGDTYSAFADVNYISADVDSTLTVRLLMVTACLCMLTVIVPNKFHHPPPHHSHSPPHSFQFIISTASSKTPSFPKYFFLCLHTPTKLPPHVQCQVFQSLQCQSFNLL